MDGAPTAKMVNESAQYQVTVSHPQAGQNNNPATITHPSGLMYLKYLLGKAIVDSKAVGSHVRANLAKLDDYMTSTAKDDVESFNDYVREQTARLSARGESSTDIMDNLFIGYLACSDQRFVSYVERIQQDWQDDPASTLTYEILMTKMESH